MRPDRFQNKVAIVTGAAMCTGTSLDADGGILVSNGSSYAEYFAARS